MSRCTSLLGHKFEPRYSKSACSGFEVKEGSWCSEVFVENMAEKTRSVTYVCDVCVRCGAIVKPEVQS